MPSNIQTGRLGEQIACRYLSSKEYSIIERNFRTRYGEVDIIAKKDNKIIFVEVKTRVGTLAGQPYEAITFNKIKHFTRTAELYVLQKKLQSYKLSVHAVSVVLKADQSVLTIRHYEDLLL